MHDQYKNYIVQFQGAVPGSPAVMAGMKKGDIIISVNGTPTPDFNAYLNAIENRGAEQQMIVLREGQLIEVVLKLNGATSVVEEPDYEEIVKQLKSAGVIPADTQTNIKKLLN